jgi:hypothetical protein
MENIISLTTKLPQSARNVILVSMQTMQLSLAKFAPMERSKSSRRQFSTVVRSAAQGLLLIPLPRLVLHVLTGNTKKRTQMRVSLVKSVKLASMRQTPRLLNARNAYWVSFKNSLEQKSTSARRVLVECSQRVPFTNAMIVILVRFRRWILLLNTRVNFVLLERALSTVATLVKLVIPDSINLRAMSPPSSVTRVQWEHFKIKRKWIDAKNAAKESGPTSWV